jgi:hypothetical protein
MSSAYFVEVDGYEFGVISMFDPDGIVIHPDAAQFDNPDWLKALKTAVESFPYLYARDYVGHYREGYKNDRLIDFPLEYLEKLAEKARVVLEGRERGVITVEDATLVYIHNVFAEVERRQTKERIKAAKVEKANRPNFGYVYILRSETGHYKIGRTTNPEDRLTTFSVKLPFRVNYELVISSDHHRQFEIELHKRFADKRIDGEWFALTTEDIEALRQEYGSS